MRKLAAIALSALILLPQAAGAQPMPMPAPVPAATPPAFPKTEAERQAFASLVCGELQDRAQENALPEAFMARLIWKESLFDPGAVSPKGAQGLAQFMPGTAKLRNLADPFDVKSAIAASASYLAELRTSFGNLGLAAAAYNSGEDRVRRWLAGDSTLPYETQDYVLAITGRSHDEWKAEGAAFDIPPIGKSGTFAEQCVSLVMREIAPQQAEGQQVTRAGWKPWGVVLSGGFSEARALQAFRTIKSRYAVLKNEEPLVLRKRNRSMGRVKMVQVQVGRDTRAAAESLCQQVTALGGACLVEKN